MAFKYEISQEQKTEIEQARKKNRNKRLELKLKVLSLRAEGKNLKEISEITDYNYMYVSKIVAQFVRKGLSYFTQNHYGGNRRNVTYEQEAALLAPYLQRAEQGQIVSVAEIAAACQDAVDHKVNPTQIYAVLKRHGWRKVMPRSRHPRKVCNEVIETSKKLTIAFRDSKIIHNGERQTDVPGRSRLQQNQQAQILLVQ